MKKAITKILRHLKTYTFKEEEKNLTHLNGDFSNCPCGIITD